MSDMEMNNEVEIEEFADEMSDEALDRDQAGKAGCICCICRDLN